MANSSLNPQNFYIQGDGLATTAAISLGYAPASVTFVSASKFGGVDVSSNITSAVLVGSTVNVTFVAAFSYLVNLILNITPVGTSNVAVAGTVSVTGTFFQATQPVSAASLPLPTGASTAAKQPALGTAGTPSVDVITVQGAASMTALKVDGSGVTQPVSGTVTANVGTTNGLALDATLTGGTQKTKIVDTGGTNVATVSAAGAVKVDGSAVTQPENLTQVAGSAVVTAATGILKVGVVGGTGTSLETTAGVVDENIKNVGNAAVVTAAAGVQKVGIVGNAGAAVDAATGAAVPANGVYQGVRATTTNPANATGGNLVGLMADKAGRLVTTSGHVRDLQSSQSTTIAASGTETTIVTAGAAGVFNDLCLLIITGGSTVATSWTLRSATAGTLIFTITAPLGVPVVIPFNPPLAQGTAAANWTIQAGTGTSTAAQVFAQFVKNT